MRKSQEAFLLNQGFQQSTLDLLNDKNLSVLADQYKYDPAYKAAI